VLREDLPSSAGLLLHLAALSSLIQDATSISFALTNITGSEQTLTVLKMTGDNVFITEQLGFRMSDLAHPIQGTIRATDNRTSCRTKDVIILEGGCFAEVPFYLYVAEFNPVCPQTVYKFTQLPTTTVSWKSPKLFSNGCSELTLHSSPYGSGSVFSVGLTSVKYKSIASRSQESPSLAYCSFNVRFLFVAHLFEINTNRVIL
jgi:hypothetical protein